MLQIGEVTQRSQISNSSAAPMLMAAQSFSQRTEEGPHRIEVSKSSLYAPESMESKGNYQ